MNLQKIKHLFSDVFKSIDGDFSLSIHCHDTEELTSLFVSTCENTSYIVAPLRVLRAKPKTEPWLNDTTHAATHECRRAERQLKKERLQISCIKKLLKLKSQSIFQILFLLILIILVICSIP